MKSPHAFLVCQVGKKGFLYKFRSEYIGFGAHKWKRVYLVSPLPRVKRSGECVPVPCPKWRRDGVGST
jgi:hypothetical protein